MPYGENYCRLQLLFVFLILLTWLLRRVRVFRGRFPLFRCLSVIILMTCIPHSIVIGFLSGTLPGFGIIRNPAGFWNKIILPPVLRHNCFLLFRPSDVLQHLPRIIDCAVFQYRVYDPQKLAGYYYQ